MGSPLPDAVDRAAFMASAPANTNPDESSHQTDSGRRSAATPTRSDTPGFCIGSVRSRPVLLRRSKPFRTRVHIPHFPSKISTPSTPRLCAGRAAKLQLPTGLLAKCVVECRFANVGPQPTNLDTCQIPPPTAPRPGPSRSSRVCTGSGIRTDGSSTSARPRACVAG